MNKTLQIKPLHQQAQLFLNRRQFKQAHACCIQILQLKPDHADAYFLLGMISASMGQFSKAIELIDKAISIDSRSVEYFAHLARCQSVLNRFDACRESLGRAMSLEPEDALTLDTLGVIYSRLGDHQKAVGLFEQAVEKQPKNPDFQYNLASSLKFLGQFDAAEQAYEATINHAPDYYKAHSALSQLKTQSEEENHIQRLEALLPQVQGHIDAQLHLAHALSKEYEDLGQYKQAFDSLSEATAQKKAQLNYHFNNDAQLFKKVEHLFTDSNFFPRQKGFPSSEPIFILGMPRTGTTLVERIISSHSQVYSAGELQNFGLCFKKASQVQSKRILDLETLDQAVCIDYQALGQAYIESTRPATGQLPFFTDKMPLNFFNIGFILTALPQAKIICLHRNPMDTCLSNFRQLFALDYSYYNYSYDILDTGRYYLMFDRLMKFWQRRFPDRVLTVQYEKLVAKQLEHSQRLIGYCGLEWEENCLSFEKNTAAVSTASSVQVRQPMYKKALHRWKRYRHQLEPLRQLLVDADLEVDP